jgi:isopentenyl phosphate kinase
VKTIFLKLGGSLITDKGQPFTPRLEIICSIGKQIKKALQKNKSMQLLIGHGSGSFGHAAAGAVGFKEGDKSSFDPRGFQTIWLAAQKLNRIIVDEFNAEGIPVISFPPSAAIRSSKKKIVGWDISPIRFVLDLGLTPIIFGDAVFDSNMGGAIYSTEELFQYLAGIFKPDQILIAGKEEGVWADFPQKNRFISELTEETFSSFKSSISASESIDVTGGMLKKVEFMMHLKRLLPETQINIFSGEKPDAILRSLSGESLGTAIN